MFVLRDDEDVSDDWHWHWLSSVESVTTSSSAIRGIIFFIPPSHSACHADSDLIYGAAVC